ncbi:hypothetical protein Q8791_29020 [Nocardiopsis sp. CT-R113]|uniref:Scaffolding protein n=1 Tax=Nocardiopsis codii TaxID=3065942 RepID=A0ABU7KGC1_9ACTN|nr:hypothetical protein [Nocardiopsis sp. CT-R113]MEE2041274.1 hypothetical protein [Nocardiopsis sp. CT-R113]
MTDPAPTTGPTGQTPGTTPTNPPPAEQAGAPAEPAAADTAQDVESLPAWAQAVIRDARADAAKERTTAKAAAVDEFKRDLVKALGFGADGGDQGDAQGPDPAELARERDAARDQARAATLAATVYRVAADHGARPAGLLDSVSFRTAVAELDPADETALGAAITAAVTANPALAVPAVPDPGQAPGVGARGGSDPAGRPGAPAVPENLTDAYAAFYSGTTR